MLEYIDLVLVICESGRRTILSAPFNSELEKGDIVVIQSDDCGVSTFKVERVLTCSVNSKEYHFIKEYCGNDTFSKITGKISRFNYKGDSDV